MFIKLKSIWFFVIVLGDTDYLYSLPSDKWILNIKVKKKNILVYDKFDKSNLNKHPIKTYNICT